MLVVEMPTALGDGSGMLLTPPEGSAPLLAYATTLPVGKRKYVSVLGGVLIVPGDEF